MPPKIWFKNLSNNECQRQVIVDNLGEASQFLVTYNSVRKTHPLTRSAVSTLKSLGTILPFSEKGVEINARSQTRKKSWMVKFKE